MYMSIRHNVHDQMHIAMLQYADWSETHTTVKLLTHG